MNLTVSTLTWKDPTVGGIIVSKNYFERFINRQSKMASLLKTLKDVRRRSMESFYQEMGKYTISNKLFMSYNYF
jgi:hypothetical protein